MSNINMVKNRWVQWSFILLIIIVGVAFSIKILPTGYSEDLSVIGSGKNIVVLVHNKEGVRSLNLMNQVDIIRDLYKDRIEFRIAEIGTQKGAEFSRKNMAGNATLVLFNGEGTRLKTLSNVEDLESLENTLDQIFGYQSDLL
ncbi:MAG: hypothetical protein L3J70_06425 [Gammaproteobacteria bacterium]|nr:hypothetical protein [Gammaproteobacteria bacterium]